MKKIIAITVFICFVLVTLNAQESARISVSTSSDTILMGNFFEIKFTAENFDGQFIPPPLDDFEIVGGPNQSSMMSIINGKVSKSASYSYYLKPYREGVFQIKSAKIAGEGQELSTLPIEIVVVPNPDGIIQRPNQPRERSFDRSVTPVPADSPKTSPVRRKTFKI